MTGGIVVFSSPGSRHSGVRVYRRTPVARRAPANDADHGDIIQRCANQFSWGQLPSSTGRTIAIAADAIAKASGVLIAVFRRFGLMLSASRSRCSDRCTAFHQPLYALTGARHRQLRQPQHRIVIHLAATPVPALPWPLRIDALDVMRSRVLFYRRGCRR